MNSRYLRLLVVLSGAALVFSSCTLLEPGSPSAAVTVKARSSFDVSSILERVFVDDGYQTIQRTGDGITFESKASKTDNLLYGNWNESKVTQRVTVTIASRGDETYRLRCLPSVVRDPHDVSFEDQHRRFQPFSLHYGSLMREVRRQCNELWLSQSPSD